MQVRKVHKARKDVYNTHPKTGKKRLVVKKGEIYFWIKAPFRERQAFKFYPTQRDYDNYFFPHKQKEIKEQKAQIITKINECTDETLLFVINKLLN